jgi:hypothetical protein
MKHVTAQNTIAKCRNFLSGISFAILVIFVSAAGMLMPSRAEAANLSAAMMPSYNQQTTYGNALLNTPIMVWGRTWGGTAPYTYNLDFGDGATAASGSVSDSTCIGQNHTYTSGGSKTITLVVNDSASHSVTNTAVIKVFSSATHDICVNMAVEKGLFWIYRNQTTSDTNTTYWAYSSGEYNIAAAGFNVLAMEENGHFMYNDYSADIYAETVRKGLNWLVDDNHGSANYNSSCGSMAISVQGSGNPDSNGNGKGAYLIGNPIYANAVGTAALIMSQPSAQAASNTLITSGTFSGYSYFTLVQDIFDQYSWSQGDGNAASFIGGWRYNMTSANGPYADGSGYDGSAQQWPNINFAVATARWGLRPAQWVIDNSMYAWAQIRNSNGSIGYSMAISIPNLAKTGGSLTGYYVGGLTNGDTLVTNATAYVGSTWWADIGYAVDGAGWAGDFYAMYGVKKGLFLQGITTVHNATYGDRDWYNDLSAWLLGNNQGGAAALAGMPYVPNTLAADKQSTSYGFGPASDGSWSAGNSYMPNTPYIDTGVAILVLTKSVTVESPVAVIAPVGTQSKHAGRPPTPFALDGSGSYHQDSGKSIVEWLWNWGTNTVDWANPDASGSKPTNPGYNSTGTYTITLRVKDNSTPTPLYSTATITISVLDQDVAPVAIAIPSGMPAYSGHIGDNILLDGSASYDPDGDTITNYVWDLNGNGVYGDAGDISTPYPTATVSFASVTTKSIGLQVAANGKIGVSAAQVDIYASASDLSAVSLSASSVVPGVSADLHAVFLNDPASGQDFNNVVVRFYNGDPMGSGSQLSTNYQVNLPKGVSVPLNVHLTGLAGVSNVYVYVDANQQIPEWNETNNTAFVSVASAASGCISLTPTSVPVTATYQGSNPSAQIVGLSNPGAGSFAFTSALSYGAGATGWLTVTPSAATIAASGSISLTNAVNITGLNAGTYYATNRVTSSDATNSPQSYVVVLTVNKANQTGLTFAPSGIQTYDTTNGLSASGGETSGGWTYTVQSGPGYINGTNLVMTSGTGAVVVCATLAGNSNFNDGTVVFSVSAQKANQSMLSFDAIPDQYKTYTVNLHAMASSGLPVSFAVVSGPAQITGGTTLSFTGTGWVSIRATQSGDSNWNATPLALTNTFRVFWVEWVSTPVTTGVYGQFYRYDLFAWDDQLSKPITYSGANLPPGLTITNLDLIDTIAGSGVAGFSGDTGRAVTGMVNAASAMAVDSAGNVYIADTGNNRIRLLGTNGVMTTFAGTGDAAFGGDGSAAISATFNAPAGVAVDTNGNVFVADMENNRIRRIDAVTGHITTVAGNGSADFTGDGGQATSATLNWPSGVAVGSDGSLYIADQLNCRIRKVSAGGIITTLAGNGVPGYNGENSDAIAAQLNYPTSVAVDKTGNVYVADQYNNRIRKVGADGSITTIAGTGDYGYDGDGGPATAALLNYPYGVAVDDLGNVSIADTENACIRFVTPGGVITTIAGNGNFGDYGDGGPAKNALLNYPYGVAVDRYRNIYLADYYNYRIKKIWRSAAMLTGVPTAAGDYPLTLWASDGVYSNAQSFTLHIAKAPASVFLSNLSYMYDSTPKSAQAATDPDGKTVVLTFNGSATLPVNAGSYAVTGTISDANWQGTASSTLVISRAPLTITANDTNKVYGDSEPALTASYGGLCGSDGPDVVSGLTLTTATGAVATVGIHAITAANAVASNYSITFAPGTLTVSKATLTITADDKAKIYGQSDPTWTAHYAGFQYADTNTAVSGLVFNRAPGENVGPYTITPSGATSAEYDISFATGTLAITKATAAVVLHNLSQVYDGNAKVVTATTTPDGLTVNITYNGAATPPVNVNTYAVTGTVQDANWQGTVSGTLTILKGNQTITFPAIGVQFVTNIVTLTATASSGLPVSFSVISGPAAIANGTSLSFAGPDVIFIAADQAGNSNWNPAAEVVNSFLVRTAPTWTSTSVTNAVCFEPYTYPLQATDEDDWMFTYPPGSLPDWLHLETNYNNRLIWTIAGNGITNYTADGIAATNSALNKPSGVTIGTGNRIYIADQYNHRIRWIKSNGVIETFAGTGTAGFNGDGVAATNAQLNFPADVAKDAAGNIYVADRDNNRIRMIDINGVITTVAGSGVQGSSGDNGQAVNARLYKPTGVVVDAAGRLYIADCQNNRVRVVNTNGIITTLAGTGTPGFSGDNGPAGSAKLNNPIRVTLDNAGNVYISDQNNQRVRKVSTSGTITTVAGSGTAGFNGDGGLATSAQMYKPYGLSADSVGNLYIADMGNQRVRMVDVNGMIWTVAGTGTAGFSGDNGPATNAQMNAPFGLASDAQGNIFFADNNNQRVRRIDWAQIVLAGTPQTSGVYSVEMDVTDGIYTTRQFFAISVAKAVAGVTLNPLSSSPYDGTPKPATINTTPDGLNAIFTYNGSTDVPINAGTYVVTGMVVDASWQGVVTGLFTIGKAELTITANDATKTYGDTVSFAGTEFTQSGLVDGDTIISVTLASDGAAAAATVITPGPTYAIAPSAAQGSGLDNYDITYQDGTLTVNKKPLTITAKDAVKVYGTDMTFAGTEFTSSGLEEWDSITSVVLSSSGTQASAVVAQYDIAPFEVHGSGLANYDITCVNGTLTVNKKNLAITANNETKTYGQTLIFAGTEFSSAGLCADDSITSVTLASLGAPISAHAAIYSIVPSAAVGTGLDNYTITYNSGLLTVGKATATILFGNLTQTYDGTAKSVTTATTPSGLNLAVTYNGSPTAPTAAGSYTVAGTINEVNYQGTSNVTLVINLANQTITFAPIATQLQSNQLALAATASSGLPVGFTVGSGPAVITSGTNLSFTGPGTVSIVAAQPGNANWNPATSVTNTFNVLALFTVVVQSDHGVAMPVVGTNVYIAGTVVTNTMVAIDLQGGLTQFVCRGWAMTGNDPATGKTTKVVMTVTNNAVLTWLWTSNYWLHVVATNGTVNVQDGWQPGNALLWLTADANQYYTFADWSGDMAGDDNPGLLEMQNASRTVVANFSPVMTTTSPAPVPYWWLAQHGCAGDLEVASTNVVPGKGDTFWSEYVAGTDPANPSSRLAITSLGMEQQETGGQTITWPSVEGRVYTLECATDLLQGFTPVVGADNLPATPPFNVYTNAPGTLPVQMFYRVKVWLAP